MTRDLSATRHDRPPPLYRPGAHPGSPAARIGRRLVPAAL